MVAQELNKSPFFKIIIPNYNNGKYIEACLNSILKQTFQEFEIIIIDDVSDDNSVEIINKYCKEYSNIHSILLKEKRWNGYVPEVRKHMRERVKLWIRYVPEVREYMQEREK